MLKTSGNEKIGVIGLGYVGLPIAVILAEKYGDIVGFDINPHRICELSAGQDATLEINAERLANPNLTFTSDPQDLQYRTFFIVTVPTPIDENNNPDLEPIRQASRLVGSVLKKGAIVSFESTVYPGVTEEICRPILAEISGLEPLVDFKMVYSPERINPGDKEHTIDKIKKVVSGEDEEAISRAKEVYGSIVQVGLHVAPSIKVAEAAKVLENTQRDLNIALMNELALICDRMEIRTMDVLEAAGTKWNFLPFRPGLVGGHCIGVDPYYLTTRAQALGYHPEVILSGRKINDGMGAFIAQKLVKMFAKAGIQIKNARVGIFGLTFKENVPDARNSKVPDIVNELKDFGVNCLVHDPWVNPKAAKHEYGIDLVGESDLRDLDAVLLAVPHHQYMEKGGEGFRKMMKDQGIFFDVKSAIKREDLGPSIQYWSL